jgi:hypothetical protein
MSNDWFDGIADDALSGSQSSSPGPQNRDLQTRREKLRGLSILTPVGREAHRLIRLEMLRFLEIKAEEELTVHAARAVDTVSHELFSQMADSLVRFQRKLDAIEDSGELSDGAVDILAVLVRRRVGELLIVHEALFSKFKEKIFVRLSEPLSAEQTPFEGLFYD